MTEERGEANPPQPPSTLEEVAGVSKKDDAVAVDPKSRDNTKEKGTNANDAQKDVAMQDSTSNNEAKQAVDNNNTNSSNGDEKIDATPNPPTTLTKTPTKAIAGKNHSNQAGGDGGGSEKSTKDTVASSGNVQAKNVEKGTGSTHHEPDGITNTNQKPQTEEGNRNSDNDNDMGETTKTTPKNVGSTSNATGRTLKRNRSTTPNATGDGDGRADHSKTSELSGPKEHQQHHETSLHFRSSAKHALAKALSLATKETEMATLQSSNTKVPVPIEVLRDLINQHPGEFWQPQDTTKGKDATTSTPEKTTVVEQKEIASPSKEGGEDAHGSEKEAKRRKLEHGDKGQAEPIVQPQPQKDLEQQQVQKGQTKDLPSLDDRETLEAVRVLLEASLQKLSSTAGKGDSPNDLLEQLKAALSRQATSSTSAGASGAGLDESTVESPPVPMDVDGEEDNDKPETGVQRMARKVTLSLVQDLSEVLKAMTNARSALDPPTRNESTEESNYNPQASEAPINLPSSVEASLLCDEEDLAHFKEEGKDDDENDDEIIEISPDENYVQQHLVCNETEEGLFGKEEPNGKSESGSTQDHDHDEDLLIAQKVALLRETKRLIRAKTLVLTKRRLAIQGDDDHSVVI